MRFNMTPQLSIPRLIAPEQRAVLVAAAISSGHHHSIHSIGTDGISDLGESIQEPVEETSSVGDYEGSLLGGSCQHQPMMYYGGGATPVITTVQALQQQTLQHMALAN